MFKNFTKDHTILLTSVAIFLLLIPLALSVNFMQNDDWVYYKTVSSFMHGNFAIDPYISATFYLQGIFGALFSVVLGLQKLPILTLIFSCLNFYLVATILKKYFGKSYVYSILLAIIIFLNPLQVYSMLGFMTENYFIFFLLMSIYFICEFKKSDKPLKPFILTNLFIVLGYFVRQISLVTLLAFAILLLWERKWKFALYQLGVLIASLLIHFFVIPKRWGFYENSLVVGNLIKPYYINTFVIAVLVYLCAFTLPIVLYCCSSTIKSIFCVKFYKYKILVVVMSVFAVVCIFSKFKVYNLPVGEFYYFENTVVREGFYADDINGTPYNFVGYFKFYKYLEILSKFSVFLVLVIFIVNIPKSINLFSIYIVGYIAVLVFFPVMYDRYLLPLYPVFIFYLLQTSFEFNNSSIVNLYRTVLVLFICLILFYSYNFTMNFLVSERYALEKASILVDTGVKPEDINPTRAWRQTYINRRKNWTYLFSHDILKSKPLLGYSYTLIQQFRVEYPLNFFVNPYIYLYKLKN